jgi:hypothetical protein
LEQVSELIGIRREHEFGFRLSRVMHDVKTEDSLATPLEDSEKQVEGYVKDHLLASAWIIKREFLRPQFNAIKTLVAILPWRCERSYIVGCGDIPNCRPASFKVSRKVHAVVSIRESTPS